ncbi:MAG: 1-phosphofructokinase family hexose kinase [Sphingomonadales bacterium]|jgi:6-phosphofructokinase 2|nr:1-phosphofructokinase family hexose kinase [Sphingomonadales bacterium]
MPAIITLTFNPTIDEACETETVHPTHKIRTRNARFDPGGGGINVARVLTRLGDAVEAWHLAGGSTGSVLDGLLHRDGVARRAFPIAGDTRISHAVFETSSGLEYRFVPEGPDVSASEWQSCLGALRSAAFDWLIISGSLPRGMPSDGLAAFLDVAAAKGARAVLDTSGPALEQGLRHGGLELVKPSRGELEKLVGRTLPDADAVMAAAQTLVDNGAARLVAVTLGHEGAILVGTERPVILPAIAVPVHSAVGAGDSFLAGMVHALAQGLAAEIAFRHGIAAGTAAVMTPGTDLCQPADMAALLAASWPDPD